MQKQELTETIMLKEFGPLMGGEDLHRALGYRTGSAFARAVRMKTLGVATFEIPGRRGRFALTTDVVAWLLNLRRESQTEMLPAQSLNAKEG